MRVADRVSVPRTGKLTGVARMGAAHDDELMVTMKLDQI